MSVIDLLLVVPGIELSPVDRFGGTPLDDAYRHGNRLCITVLQLVGAKRGTDPEVRIYYLTPLIIRRSCVGAKRSAQPQAWDDQSSVMPPCPKPKT